MWTYETLETPLIANTIMVKVLYNGVHRVYRITPAEGYVLHDAALDYTDIDGNWYLGYSSIEVSCGAAYDFEANERGFYTLPVSEVPADQIFGVGNDHEVM